MLPTADLQAQTNEGQENEINYVGTCDMVLTELCSELFASLPRSDQRRKGREYLRGLLSASGRKSIRSVAALLGDPAKEQGLHHFISSSTWDWSPVRRALAQYVVHSAPLEAWVVRPMVIPKTGEHSVGVDRHFCPNLGHVLNAQQAVGVWAASEEMCIPVEWRLHLSRSWLADGARRRRASIPDEIDVETLSDCTVEAYLEMTARQELPPRPVVLDARQSDVGTTIRKLRGADAPLLVRINSTLRLTTAEAALSGQNVEDLPAHQIIDAAKNRRRPATRMERRPSGALQKNTSLAATIRVRMPGRPRHAAADELLLLGTCEIGQPWPTELWLTDLMDAQPAVLVRLSKLIQRVDRDFTDISDQVGIRDFAGRSFTGWHRHVTLASAAHAVASLAGCRRSRNSLGMRG